MIVNRNDFKVNGCSPVVTFLPNRSPPFTEIPTENFVGNRTELTRLPGAIQITYQTKNTFNIEIVPPINLKRIRFTITFGGGFTATVSANNSSEFIQIDPTYSIINPPRTEICANLSGQRIDYSYSFRFIVIKSIDEFINKDDIYTIDVIFLAGNPLDPQKSFISASISRPKNNFIKSN